MKNATGLPRWPCLLQDSQQTFTVQNKTAQKIWAKTITHHFFVSGNWAEENCRCSQNLWRRRKCWNRNPATFVNGLLGFITLGIYTAGSACVLLTIIAELPIDMGKLYLHCSLTIYLGSFQLFLGVMISLFWGWNNLLSGVCQSGRRTFTPEAVVASRTDWQTALMCKTDDDQRQHHHAEHHFQL